MRAVRDQGLLQRESLPTGAVPWVQGQLLRVLDTQQEVQDTAVPQKHPRGLDEPLAEVFEPRRQHPDHEGTGEQVAVVVHGGRAHIHGPRQFRRVPDLAVPVGEHPPEAPERLGGDLRAQSGDVAFEEGPGERAHPPCPRALRRSEPRTGKAAAHPETVLMAGSDLVEGKPGDVHELDPSGERFGDPPDQVPRRAAQQQKDRLPIRVVADGAERFEQLGQPLHFVHDDEPLPVAQRAFGSPGKGFPDFRPFQIEEDGRFGAPGRDLPGHGCFADLAGAEQSDDRSFGEALLDDPPKFGAIQLLLNIHCRTMDIQQ